MSTALIFMTNWRKWQRVLRSRKGFGLIDSCPLWPLAGTWLGDANAQSKASGRNVQKCACGMRKEGNTQ